MSKIEEWVNNIKPCKKCKTNEWVDWQRNSGKTFIYCHGCLSETFGESYDEVLEEWNDKQTVDGDENVKEEY